MNVLNGVRALAMLYVIFGHEYGFVLGGVENIMSTEPMTQTWFYVLVSGGLFAVDTFFFIGGFLAAYAVLK